MKQNGNRLISNKNLYKAVFFDRDGVVNKPVIKKNKPYPPANLNELIVYDDFPKIIKILKKYGFMTFIITNQPDFKRGSLKKENIDEINSFLKENYNIDDIFCCFHDDDDNCGCRKPKPGAFFYFAQKYNINLKKSYMVGDRKKDILAANAAKCLSVFIDHGYNEDKPTTFDYLAKDLKDVIKFILFNEV